MHSKRNNGTHTLHRLSPLLVATILLLLIPGCARKPWQQPIDGNRLDNTLSVVEQMRREEAARSNCIDADVAIYYTSTITDRAVSGYVLLMQPQSVKFVTANPLGQPVFALVSDGGQVQFVNTLESLYAAGEAQEFAESYSIPRIALASDWGTWLTARLPRQKDIITIREDADGRGLWLEMNGKNAAFREQVLLDTDRRQVVERAFTSPSGTIEARLVYEDLLPETSNGKSIQPGTITISELDYSGKVILKFSRLQTVEDCRPSDFRLRRPPGYNLQRLTVP